MKRNADETYDDYRERRANEKKKLKKYLRGRMWHHSANYTSDNNPKVFGSTYRKAISC